MPKPKPAPHQNDEPYIWPVVGQDLDALNAITDGLALIHSILGKDAAPGIALDILAGEYPETRDLVGPIRVLAEKLMERAAANRADTRKDPDRLAAIEAINTAIREAHFRVSRRTRKDALSDAEHLIQEIGLEFHDLQCILAATPDGKDAIAARRIPPPLAHAWLIETLFQRVEAFVAVDENLALERAASAWFFECWSEGMDADDPSSIDFPRIMREKEWSLVSRDTLSLDEPAIASFTVEAKPPDVPPRQQRLATAYAQSTVGIFEVIAVDGPVVTVQDASTGQTHRYHEHSEDANPHAGLLILGRMIPLEDDLWLRSPGAVILTAAGNEFRDALSNSLTQMCETLPTPIALEGLISTAVFGAKVPVSLLPAPTVAEARAALMAAHEALEDLGLFPEIDVPPTLEAMTEQLESPALQSFELGVDQPVAEWLMALYEQASLDTPRSGRQAAKRKKRPRGKQQHTRRRKR